MILDGEINIEDVIAGNFNRKITERLEIREESQEDDYEEVQEATLDMRKDKEDDGNSNLTDNSVATT